MKILRICPSFPYKEIGGGLEPHIFNLSLAQKKLGHEIIVICGGNKNEVLEGNGFHISRFKAERPFLMKTGKRILRELPGIIKKENPDIIHIHNPIIPLSKPLSRPTVYTIHDSILSYKVYKKKILRYFKSYWEFFRTSKKIAKNSNRIVSVSSSGMADIGKNFGISEDKILYIPSGVDIKEFTPCETTDKNMILTAGRFVKKKGFIFLVKAMKQVVEKYPNSILVLLGGKESDEEYKDIVSWIKKLNLEKSVSIKTVPHNQIGGFYRDCSVYVQPSFAEGLPKTVLEAMACGKPIIATDIDGHKDAVKTGENGFLVEPGNPDVLAEKILYLLENKKTAELFGKKSLDIVKTSFTWDEAAKKYNKLYKELLKSK